MQIRLTQVQVQTKASREFVDITDAVRREVETSGVREGVVLLRSRHTTAAVACTEPDPAVHEDALALVSDLMPLSRSYRHIEEGASNAVAHLAETLLFGEGTWVAVRDGRLDLGTWQRLFLVELFEPRTRTLDVAIIGA
jgi:secondary thiamine-phosphate synthase enzyme